MAAALPMSLKPIAFVFAILITVGQSSLAQTKYSKISVDKQMKDTFSFAKSWDYSWEVFKDDSTGGFTRKDDDPLVPADTAHLFYTANCTTNVQGGYNIRYCHAYKQKDKLTLTFADGLPAYASEFYVYIKGDSFYFQPKTTYPAFYPGQKISYQVMKQKLILDKNNYAAGDILMGAIDVEFIETVSVPTQGSKKSKFYLRGFIRTPL